MQIISAIKIHIKNLNEQKLVVHGIDLAMYPERYNQLCEELHACGNSGCIIDGSMKIQGVVIRFAPIGQKHYAKIIKLDHDTVFNNILINEKV